MPRPRNVGRRLRDENRANRIPDGREFAAADARAVGSKAEQRSRIEPVTRTPVFPLGVKRCGDRRPIWRRQLVVKYVSRTGEQLLAEGRNAGLAEIILDALFVLHEV